VRYGEIHTYVPMGQTSRRRYVVVISADAYNDTGARPLCCDIVTTSARVGVALSDLDPLEQGHIVALETVGSRNPDWLATTGSMLTGATLARIQATLVALLNITP